jgi:hypothetical protein
MSRERKAAILVAIVALVLALVLVMAAGQIGYHDPSGTIPPF